MGLVNFWQMFGLTYADCLNFVVGLWLFGLFFFWGGWFKDAEDVRGPSQFFLGPKSNWPSIYTNHYNTSLYTNHYNTSRNHTK